MKSNRRDFLKASGLAGLGLASANILDGHAAVPSTPNDRRFQQGKHFNMSGYAHRKLKL
jgi:hypothetical protein